MYKLTMPFIIALAPAVLAAQASARATSQTRVDAEASAAGTRTSGSTSVDAEIAVARRKGLPTRPIENRVAEGRAKGASEAKLAATAAETRASLETAHEVLVRGGRQRPAEDEVERGGEVLAHGYTRADLEAVVSSAPADRSLVVAFDVLTRLRARGVASARALAQVTSNLRARATDAQLDALVAAHGGANVGVGAGSAAAGASGKAAAGAGATVRGTTGVVGGAAAGVTGTVKGVVKP